MTKWQGTVVPSLLVEKLLHGGCVVFASAAALTLGIATVPVYEIYKCGQDPHWLEGLDVTSVAGIRAAVIPHYDNNEGGTHDTRFCYLGERRLSIMERDLPDGAFVLGVDEHTACTFDLDAGTASVEGRGVVTVRAAGRSATLTSGETFPITRLAETAEELARSDGSRNSDAQVVDRASGSCDAPSPGAGRSLSTSPLVDLVRPREADFTTAVTARNMALATSIVLGLERDVTEWSTDIPAGDELDRAWASLRSLILELGRLSETGSRDPREVVGPLVEALWSSGARRDETVALRMPTSCGNASPSRGSKCAILPTGVSGYLRAKAPPERRPAPGNFGFSLRRSRLRVEPPSSSGRGHRPFKAETRVRIPLGVPVIWPAKWHFFSPR